MDAYICKVNVFIKRLHINRMPCYRLRSAYSTCRITIIVGIRRILIAIEVFERFRSKNSPLEKLRSKLANPVELTV